MSVKFGCDNCSTIADQMYAIVFQEELPETHPDTYDNDIDWDKFGTPHLRHACSIGCFTEIIGRQHMKETERVVIMWLPREECG